MPRYIDADKAEEFIKSYGKGAISDGQTMLDPVDDIILLAKGIDLIPTADVVEVKHGEWFLLDECANEGVYCSVCRKKLYRTEYANQKIKSKFCPNCGAKMGKKEGDVE